MNKPKTYYRMMCIEMIEASILNTGVRPVCIVLEDGVFLMLCTEMGSNNPHMMRIEGVKFLSESAFELLTFKPRY